jgi:hypothetical protein
VAEVVLRAQEDARLEVALPLPAEYYIEDFKTEDSKREFCCLLDQASDVWQIPDEPTRNDAYERAGRYIGLICRPTIVTAGVDRNTRKA